MAGKITPDAVKAGVKHFWDSFAAKSAADIADIYAFMQSLPGKRDAKGIAILND